MFCLQLAAELAEALSEEEIEEGMKSMDSSGSGKLLLTRLCTSCAHSHCSR